MEKRRVQQSDKKIFRAKGDFFTISTSHNPSIFCRGLQAKLLLDQRCCRVRHGEGGRLQFTTVSPMTAACLPANLLLLLH